MHTCAKLEYFKLPLLDVDSVRAFYETFAIEMGCATSKPEAHTREGESDIIDQTDQMQLTKQSRLNDEMPPIARAPGISYTSETSSSLLPGSSKPAPKASSDRIPQHYSHTKANAPRTMDAVPRFESTASTCTAAIKQSKRDNAHTEPQIILAEELRVQADGGRIKALRALDEAWQRIGNLEQAVATARAKEHAAKSTLDCRLREEESISNHFRADIEALKDALGSAEAQRDAKAAKAQGFLYDIDSLQERGMAVQRQLQESRQDTHLLRERVEELHEEIRVRDKAHQVSLDAMQDRLEQFQELVHVEQMRAYEEMQQWATAAKVAQEQLMQIGQSSLQSAVATQLARV